MVLTDEQLQSIWRAKQPKRGAQPIGRLLRGFSRSQSDDPGALIVQIRSAIEEVVDDSFRKHCRLVTFDRGTVTVAIDDPALVYLFRRKYVFLLREQLRSMLPGTRFCDVRFCAWY